MSVLLVAMGSAIAMATRSLTVGQKGPTAQTPKAARLMERIAADLRLAMRFSEPLAADRIEFTIPDRDGDGAAETVLYAWSGASDYELTWILHQSGDETAPPPTVIATDVRQFDLSYLTRTWGAPPPPPSLESDEVLLIGHDDAPSGDGTNILFVVTDKDAPTTQEQTREGLLVWWGFTVERISASAAQAAFDTAAANADAAYISEQINASELGSKLKDTPIGVVNEEVNLVDEFGVATAFTLPPPGRILDLDTTPHYISAPLPAGPTELFDTDQAITNIDANPANQAPGILLLGGWGALPSLSVVELGAELAESSGTPGTFGHETIFGTQTGLSEFDKKHVATRVTLSTGAKVDSIAAYLYVQINGKDVRFGIYTDDGGEPGTLIVQTEKTPLPQSTAWHSVNLTRQVNLMPGTYWLASTGERDVAYHYDPTGGETRHADSGEHAPNQGLMETWAGTYGPDPNNRRISIYANFTEMNLAAGRRVTLPWGTAGFDIGSLSDEAKTLMQRSVAWAADTSPGDPFDPVKVEKRAWPAQYFLPDLPTNALDWSISRVYVAIKADPEDLGGKVRFQIRYADSNLKPADQVITETAEIPVSTWDENEYAWYQIPFDPVADLNPDYGVCIVLKGRNDENAMIKIDRNGESMTAGTHYLHTPDEGSTWSVPNATEDMRVYVHGTYTTAGDPLWP